MTDSSEVSLNAIPQRMPMGANEPISTQLNKACASGADVHTACSSRVPKSLWSQVEKGGQMAMSHLILPDVDITSWRMGRGGRKSTWKKILFFLLSTKILSLHRWGNFFQPPKWTPVEVYTFELSNIYCRWQMTRDCLSHVRPSVSCKGSELVLPKHRGSTHRGWQF